MFRKSVITATLMVLAAGAALSGCESATTPAISSGTDDQVATPVAPDRLADAITDAWIHDDRQGYYTRPSVSGRPEISLYETYWRIRLWDPESDPALHLDPARVRTWLDPAARGELPDLRALTQITYAVETAPKVGLTIDRAATVNAIAKLRAGDQYRSAPSSDPTWGSTAVALRTLGALGTAPDARITTRAVSELDRTPKKLTPDVIVRRTAPLLEILAQAKRRTPAVENLLERSRTTLLGTGTDTVTLATLGQLNTAAHGFGLAFAQPGDDWCTAAAGNVQAQDGTDLQAIDALRRLGCSTVAAPPPGMYSRAGWLDQVSALDGLGTTAQVVRYLARAGQALTTANRAALEQTYNSVWLPEARTVDIGTPTGAVYVMRLSAVAATLGTTTPLTLSWHRPPGSAGEALNRALALAFTDGDQAAMRELATQAGSFDKTVPAITAATYETLSRSLGDQALHDRAVQLIRESAMGKGLYGLTGPATPSLTASIIGNWILKDRDRPIDTFRAAGLCAAGYRCAETAADLSGTPAGFTGYALTIDCARLACGQDYPLIM